MRKIVFFCMLLLLPFIISDNGVAATGGLPLPFSLTGARYNANGQVTGSAVRGDLQGNHNLIDQQDSVLTRTRKVLASTTSMLKSIFTGMDKKIAQLRSQQQAGSK